ncbi:DUF2141 domain-containing protein [Sphingomonas sp. MMS24-J13]|uniref:DUF2141 domain-containing protein n=1 Tax=Sphingomonas sp. MMS24-J13 TaxID=3238686 RepID=UPI00384FA94F
MTLSILAATLLLQAQSAVAAGNGVIEVVVSGIRSNQGLIHVDVCPEARFLNSCPYTTEVPAQAGTMTVTLRGVPPGRYAVQAFHDANANHDLDQNFIGIPKEGIGFSNDAMAHLMKPKWKVAAFDHGTEAQRIPVTLRYFLG